MLELPSKSVAVVTVPSPVSLHLRATHLSKHPPFIRASCLSLAGTLSQRISALGQSIVWRYSARGSAPGMDFSQGMSARNSSQVLDYMAARQATRDSLDMGRHSAARESPQKSDDKVKLSAFDVLEQMEEHAAAGLESSRNAARRNSSDRFRRLSTKDSLQSIPEEGNPATRLAQQAHSSGGPFAGESSQGVNDRESLSAPVSAQEAHSSPLDIAPATAAQAVHSNFTQSPLRSALAAAVAQGVHGSPLRSASVAADAQAEHDRGRSSAPVFAQGVPDLVGEPKARHSAHHNLTQQHNNLDHLAPNIGIILSAPDRTPTEMNPHSNYKHYPALNYPPSKINVYVCDDGGRDPESRCVRGVLKHESAI